MTSLYTKAAGCYQKTSTIILSSYNYADQLVQAITFVHTTHVTSFCASYGGHRMPQLHFTSVW